jgi:hypothetical protein
MDKETMDYIIEQMYNVRYSHKEEIMYNLRPSNNEYGQIVVKIQRMGTKKLLSLKEDAEDIYGYTQLFIYESLIEYTGDIYDLSELEQHISLYCYDRFNELSKNNGVNHKYRWNKTTKKYELIKLCKLTEDIQYEEPIIEEDSAAKDFIDSYINTDYLTEAQVKYCMAVLEYGPSNGKGIYDYEDNLLYSKQLANYYNKEIRNRLMNLLQKEQ